MKRRVVLILLVLFLVCLHICFYLFSSPSLPLPPIILYRAYYDNRSSSTRVRVLSLSPCLPEEYKESLLAEGVPLRASAVEKHCPWEWAPGCRWNAFVWEGEREEAWPEMLRLEWAGRQREIPLLATAHEQRPQLQICVPPLYWYNDWPRLLIFFQLWRTQATVLIYVNSISRHALKVLEYFEKQGVAQIIKWPSLPEAEGEDPNKSIYRLGHSLAHNDCVLRATASHVALVDIDEFIHVQNGTLLNFVLSAQANRTDIGSFIFPHKGLFFEGADELDETFKALDKVNVREVEGPGKVVFMPSRTRLLSTHRVRIHDPPFVVEEVDSSLAFLLHHRLSFGHKEIGEGIAMSSSPFSSTLSPNLRHLARSIFGASPPSYSSNVSREMNRCLSTWKESCKTPLSTCSSSLLPLDDWIFMQADSDSDFSAL